MPSSALTCDTLIKNNNCAAKQTKTNNNLILIGQYNYQDIKID
ncbi:hypothetical protein CAXC1_30007 [Candidatus Xenohaliotis californiensis]|uniref:Uncharacterized protein n=1 Tax=Candidatus Xenohaliotis californiensis TaxID=84677 RepID=A0ABM9N8X1_9RICK|nr:hypothetical protein CAXC1_30007 [Candidatus Xenohaliotis californiensis]